MARAYAVDFRRRVIAPYGEGYETAAVCEVRGARWWGAAPPGPGG